MIKPTIGRVVWYWCQKNQTQPQAAVVAYVHSDTMVNLTVFDENGIPHARTSVFLYQGQENTERPAAIFCEWMPYQKGQAAKTEALEKQVAGA